MSPDPGYVGCWCKQGGRLGWVRLVMSTPPVETYLNDSRQTSAQGEEGQNPAGKTREAYP